MSATPSAKAITQVIQAAITNPGDANLYQLLNELEQVISALPQAEQLHVAGNILAQLVEVYVARANQLLESWEKRYSPTQNEPILTVDMLQDVLRQTMKLNLEEVLEEREPQPCKPRTANPELTDSIARPIEKANILEFIDAVSEVAAKQKALAVSHAEDISQWTGAINDWMNQHHCYTVRLVELQRSLQMPLVNVWLGVLLGGYSLEQRGGFYQSDAIWVKAIASPKQVGA